MNTSLKRLSLVFYLRQLPVKKGALREAPSFPKLQTAWRFLCQLSAMVMTRPRSLELYGQPKSFVPAKELEAKPHFQPVQVLGH